MNISPRRKPIARRWHRHRINSTIPNAHVIEERQSITQRQRHFSMRNRERRGIVDDEARRWEPNRRVNVSVDWKEDAWTMRNPFVRVPDRSREDRRRSILLETPSPKVRPSTNVPFCVLTCRMAKSHVQTLEGRVRENKHWDADASMNANDDHRQGDCEDIERDHWDESCSKKVIVLPWE